MEKHFISYSCIFISYIQCFEVFFQKVRLFFQKDVFSIFSINPICFSINRNPFEKFQWVFAWFDWSNLFFDQSNIVTQVFFLKQCLTHSKHFFKSFSDFPLSLSDLARLHWGFFVVFNQIFARFFSHKAGKTFIPFLLLLFSWFHA